MKNAFTGEDTTQFYFDIKSAEFPEALDIFSQFFIAPKFNEDRTEREIKVVDSEFRKNLSSEARRNQ